MSAFSGGVAAVAPWTWNVRDVGLHEYDGELDGYTVANAVLLDGDVGTWTLTLPRLHPMAGLLLTAGAGVVVRVPGVAAPLFSGPYSHDDIVYAQDGSSVSVTGPTDEIELASDLAWADPAHALNAGTNPTSGSVDARTGLAEDVFLAYVKANIGSTALVARRRSYLTIPASSARGSSGSWKAQFDQLLDIAKTVLLGQPITWRIVQSGPGALALAVRTRADVSADVVFSRLEESLKAATFSQTAPETTQVLSMSDDGTTRTFVTVTDATAETKWGRRFSTLVNADSSTVADLTQAANDGIAAGAETAGATMEALVQPEAPQFGVDYFLGDKVTVVDDFGDPVVDHLAQMTYTHQAGAGPRLEPSVGFASVDQDSTLLPIIRDMQSKLRILSRRG